jgi:hypothetical protein
MSKKFLENRILLKYSDVEERATVFDPELENFDFPKKQKKIIKLKKKEKNKQAKKRVGN